MTFHKWAEAIKRKLCAFPCTSYVVQNFSHIKHAISNIAHHYHSNNHLPLTNPTDEINYPPIT